MNRGKEVDGLSDVIDVAEYILERLGPTDTMKLQKLVYYAQAWSLAWTDHPLFSAPIEAWRDGPVCPQLYQAHRKVFTVTSIGGKPKRLTNSDRDTVDSVLGFYGEKSGQWLSDSTHREDPWRDARRGLLPFQSGQREITHDAMRQFYRHMAQVR